MQVQGNVLAQTIFKFIFRFRFRVLHLAALRPALRIRVEEERRCRRQDSEWDQDDQIGRIFAYWALAFFGQFF
jgi:hypothetical protein